MTPHREYMASSIVTAAIGVLYFWVAAVFVQDDWVLDGVLISTPIVFFLIRHRYRVLGLLPPALTLAAATVPYLEYPVADVLFVAAVGANFAVWLRTARRVRPVRIGATYYLTAAAVVIAFVAVIVSPTNFAGYAVPAAIVVATAFAWITLFRPFFELCVAPPLWLSYKIRGAGPGLTQIPRTGPVIVLANHACWWDPLFVTKVLPRPITAMMTSKFYDVKVLTPLFKYVFEAIRVPDVSARRDAPELAQAIAAIDAGRVLVLFPEGVMRRREDQPLRRFGRGVWEILKARPDTPVITCWIGGNWGAWPSYRGGPPTKNKKIDVRRPITVGVSAAEVVPAEALETHLATRFLLMRRVAAAAALTGEPVPAVEFLPADDAA